MMFSRDIKHSSRITNEKRRDFFWVAGVNAKAHADSMGF
jgi:hypothetical protein